jgi:hypothetical protein
MYKETNPDIKKNKEQVSHMPVKMFHIKEFRSPGDVTKKQAAIHRSLFNKKT